MEISEDDEIGMIMEPPSGGKVLIWRINSSERMAHLYLN
jgi:hypothetical protein